MKLCMPKFIYNIIIINIIKVQIQICTAACLGKLWKSIQSEQFFHQKKKVMQRSTFNEENWRWCAIWRQNENPFSFYCKCWAQPLRRKKKQTQIYKIFGLYCHRVHRKWRKTIHSCSWIQGEIYCQFTRSPSRSIPSGLQTRESHTKTLNKETVSH